MGSTLSSIIEIDHLSSSALDNLLELNTSSGLYDCILISESEHSSACCKFAKTLFNTDTYFNIRIFDLRIATILSFQRMYSHDFFYPFKFYENIKKLDLDVKEIKGKNIKTLLKNNRLKIINEFIIIETKKVCYILGVACPKKMFNFIRKVFYKRFFII